MSEVKHICPKCGEEALGPPLDDFEINMLRYMHKDGKKCWVRIANREPKLPPELPGEGGWNWTK